MLNSIFESSTVSSIGIVELFISLFIAIILGFMISLVHKYTSKYSKNFLITITLLPILVETVMLMVNGNLGTSIAIMGAFSLVRFRSIPGTSREILIVFFAMSVGLACGMGQVWFAIIITIICCVLLFLLNKISLFDKDKKQKNLKVLIPENLDYDDIFQDIFDEFTDYVYLEKTKTVNMGSMFELSYIINLKDNIKEKEFIDKIRMRNSNLKVVLERVADSYDL
mgnify:CR=1 FL=1